MHPETGADPLTPDEQHVLHLMRGHGGVASIAQPTGSPLKVHIGPAASHIDAAINVERTVAAINGLLRQHLIERTGGSQCAETFRLTREGQRHPPPPHPTGVTQ
jgi:hypothetical protein